MFKKSLVFVLAIVLVFSSQLAVFGNGNEIPTLTKEQLQLLQKMEKEFQKHLLNEGLDLDSEEAKELIEHLNNSNIKGFEIENSTDLYQAQIKNNQSGTLYNTGLILYATKSFDTYFVGHTATVNQNTQFITDAMKSDKVRVTPNNWNITGDFGTFYGLFVFGAHRTIMEAAANYAESQVNKPYGFPLNRMSEDRFYCSQLTWRAYFNQGFNFDNKTSGYIYPTDIFNSDLTYVVYSYTS